MFDPIVQANFRKKNLKVCKNVEDAIRNTDLLIITTPWSSFKKINLNFLKKNVSLKTVIDPFSILNRQKLQRNGIKQISMGEKNEL